MSVYEFKVAYRNCVGGPIYFQIYQIPTFDLYATAGAKFPIMY